MQERSVLACPSLFCDHRRRRSPAACSLLRRLWPQMHPRYLHALRIDPDKLDAIKLDRLWKSLGDEEAEGLQGRDGRWQAQPR